MRHTSALKPTVRAVLALFLVISTFILPSASAGADPAVRYAAPSAQGDGDCSSWEDACTLQTALTGAASGQEVWVKMGVYKPTSDPGSPSVSFQVLEGVAVYGGFAGAETSREQRDWRANLTILSGDIDNNDLNTDGNFIAEDAADIQGTNSYHVVLTPSVSAASILDGFVITAGYADNIGGGVFNYFGAPTLANLLIIGNHANGGAGMHNYQSSPTLTNVTFKKNTSTGSGGGLVNYYGCSVNLNNVAFIQNSAGTGGGGMDNYVCTVNVNGGLFLGNTAAGSGGISSNQSTINVKDATFYGNTATGSGGGIGVYFSSLTLRNVIMWGDQASSLNEIINVRDKYGDYSSGISVAYSDIQGCGGSGAWAGGDCGSDGGGNIDSDPLFLDPANGSLRLSLTSPAVDAGSNSDVPAQLTVDLDGLGRFVDIDTVADTGSGAPPIVDMGAYEAHVDETAPAVVSITRLDPSPTSASTVRFLVVFSEPVSGLDIDDFSPAAVGLSGASVTAVSGGPAAYQVTVGTGAGSGYLRLDMPEDAEITDLRMNPLGGLPYASSEVYSVDKTAPTVVSIVRLDPSPTNADSVDYEVTFSEAVENVHRSDFSILSTGIVGDGLEDPVDSGDHIRFTIEVNTGTGNGTIQLRVTAMADIHDPAGNLLSGLPYTDGEVYEIYKAFVYLPVVIR